ncbi:putative ribonuclease III [Mimivirus AB-566-O17]|uniref:Putative ribonuclease III n=1 Tax=Mimivirus AB-566-O17 TaxID=1988039 RepID=A0A1X9VNX0_9VIRU|nr:putative ribonuclease III [Mimivirus AB-566-O17]
MNNKQNCVIAKGDIEAILNYYGGIGDNGEWLEVKDLGLYQKAFVHESYHQACKSNTDACMSVLLLSDESNERLEFLGDNALKYIMGNYLYERFPTEREGFLTRLKIKLEQTKELHKFAVSLNFSKWLLLSKEVEAHTILSPSSGRNTRSFYEDAFEAFIGSLVLDNSELGIVYASRFVRNVIENSIDFGELIARNDNFKDSIQRFYQSNKWRTPEYTQLVESGPGYRKNFTRVLYIDSKVIDKEALVYTKIRDYSNKILESFKVNPEVYKKMFDKVTNGYLVLGMGTASKVTESEQLCARDCLLNFDLPLDY